MTTCKHIKTLIVLHCPVNGMMANLLLMPAILSFPSNMEMLNTIGSYTMKSHNMFC